MSNHGLSPQDLFEYTPEYDTQFVDFSEQHPLVRYVRYSAAVRSGDCNKRNSAELARAWSDLKEVVASMVTGDYPPTMVETMPAYLMSVSIYLVGTVRSYGFGDLQKYMYKWLDYTLNDSQLSWCSPVECPIVRLAVSAMRDEVPPSFNLYPDACKELKPLWEYRSYVYYRDTLKFSKWAGTQPNKVQILSFALMSVLDVWQSDYSKRRRHSTIKNNIT